MAARPGRRGKTRRGYPLYDEDLAAADPSIGYSAATVAGTATATLSAIANATADLSASGSATAGMWNPEGGYGLSQGASTATATSSANASAALSGTGASVATLGG